MQRAREVFSEKSTETGNETGGPLVMHMRDGNEMLIILTNVINPEQAAPLVGYLEGRSYMNLRVGLAPAGGSLDVVVETDRPDTSEEELREMVLELLCHKVMDG